MTDLTIQTGPQGHMVFDSEGRKVIDGLDAEQAEYAVMLLENDGLGDLAGLDNRDIAVLVAEAVEPAVQTDAGVVFRAETREWAL